MTIQVFPPVGGEKGILVKNYLKIPISSLWSISSKIPKTPLKIGTFQNQKNRGGENGMTFPGGENGISRYSYSYRFFRIMKASFTNQS